MLNPYFNTDVCVERLLRVWRKHRKLIIAVDYDETIISYDDRGCKYQDITEILKECCELGFHICLFTSSEPSRHPKMLETLEGLGIKISSVNSNPLSLPYGNHGKMYFNILLDDRAGLAQSYEILRKTLDIIKTEKL